MRNFTPFVQRFIKPLMVTFIFSTLFVKNLKAQTDFSIGTGTVGNANTTYPCPIQDWYEGSRAQYLYLASELTAAGMFPGYINSIKFNAISLNAFSGDVQNFEVKIAGTSVATLSTTSWENVTNTVFGPVNYVVTLGVNTLTFSTPFFWNGTDNIVIDICNGLPANVTDGLTHYSENPTFPWTTGLSFNGSHTYRADNAGNLCGATATTATTQTTRPNITFNLTPASACSGTPTGGTANSTSTNILCTGTPFTLSLSGATVATGLNYQWQSSPNNTSWTNISGATNMTYTTTQTAPVLYYRCVITCTNGGATANSTSIQVNASGGPTYTTLPYTESFEATWMNGCSTRDVPNASWFNTPATGNNSWRRDDDGNSAAWTSTNGTYTPAASLGNRSARFHSYNTPLGTSGTLDLYVNCNSGVANKRLQYDFINTSGNDSLTILLSTDGGTTYNRLDSASTSATWKTKTIYFSTLSATCILRFKLAGDNGSTDFGLDNIFLSNWADCSGTPLGGTAIATPANVCAGVPISLSATGFAAANGISYQWQVSTNGGTTWSDIVGATSINSTTTQVATSKYRLKVTCTLTGGGDGFSSEATVTSPILPGGTYTINKTLPTTWPGPPGSNFASFNAAYTALACGVSAPVVFNVVSGTGPYNEQLLINGTVAGTSAVNTVTFNGNGETISFAPSSSTERAVIKLQNTKYFNFRNLVVNASTGTYGFGFHLINNADSNLIKKCTINTNLTATSTNFAGIVISGSASDAIGTGTTLCDYNVIDSNTVNGGYYGITQTATFSGGANGYNKITNNTIQDFYQYGIYVAASYNTTIEKNIITRPTRATVTDFYGIHFTAQSNNAFISKNKIINPFGGNTSSTSAFYGINFNSSSPSAGNDYIVSNNVIASANGLGLQYGINNTSTSSIQLFNNTISLDDATSTATTAARCINISGTPSGIFFYNNILSITRGGAGTKHCFYSASTIPLISDNNDFYINSPAGTNSVGYFGTNQTTLANWQTATTQDVSSLSLIPVFLNPISPSYDYSPTNAAIDNRGLPGLVVDDINNVIRSTTTPDIGAYEFVPPPCVAPPVVGATAVNPTTICENSSVSLNVSVAAYGAAQTFQWQSSPTLAGTYTNVGNPKLTPDTTILATTTLYYRCAVTCGGATVYSNPVLLTVNPAFKAGTYTINNTAPNTYVPGVVGGNFTSYNLAYNAAATCGILGPVVFNVAAASGPYNEQLILDSIKGMSAVNTITFNGNATTINFSSSNTNERAVIKFKRADYFVFDNLIIDARGSNAYGYGIQMINNADSNIVKNCTILASETSTSTSMGGIVINAADANATTLGNTWCDANQFTNNTISGGFYGVTLVGNTGAALLKNNIFRNNIVKEFYSYGFYMGGTDGTIIDSNVISRPTRSLVSIGYGIYLTGAVNNNLTISKNTIKLMFGGLPNSTLTGYGIYHNTVSSPAGSENNVINNLIYQISGNGAAYGIYNVATNNVNYYHNTVALDNATSSTTSLIAGFYQTTAATGLNFFNNNITINHGGNGSKYCIYLNTVGAGGTSINANNNNYYVNNGIGNNNFVGRFGTTNTATLTAWQTASTYDATSTSLDPIYVDATTGNYKPQALAMDNKGANKNIITDIVNVVRNVTTPDIGAFEFAPAPCPTLVGGTATVTPNSGLCLEMPIRLNLTGATVPGSVTYQWQISANGTSGWTNLSGILYTPLYDTVTTVANYYRCLISCGTNTSIFTYSTVTSVNLNAILAGGTYTIDGTTPTTWPTTGNNFNTFQEAVNALKCGIQSSVIFDVKPGTYNEQIEIPYVAGTSATKTVTFKAQNGVASSANLTYASTVPTSNYTLKLDSTFYIYFRNLTINATGLSYGRAVEISGTSANDSITNCIINTPTVINTSNNFTGIYANPLRNTNIVIKGNAINNGAYGIYINGVSSATKAVKEVIDSNTIVGAYYTGIYTANTEQLKLNRNTISLSAPSSANTYGIYTLENDSSFEVRNNRINIANTSGSVYGIYISNSDGSIINIGKLNNNDIVCGAGNTSSFYGIYINASPYLNINNNTVAVNTSGANSYGIYNNNSANGNYYNNAISSVATSVTNNYAMYINNNSAAAINLNNNIFSHKSGGKAMFIYNSQNVKSNYNMLYTTGVTLVQRTLPTATNYATLLDWRTAALQDAFSIVYKPAFVSDVDLHPNLANDSVWAMHGRGVQIVENNTDHDNNSRPTTLLTGVPDLGAYEFYPTALPTVLNAIPATPAPNTEQTFYYGSDTVMRIKWAAVAPTSVQIRRYSGVVPAGLAAQNLDSMYFYTKVDIPGGGSYDYDAKLYYIDSWLGSIPQPSQLGLGKTTAGNAWIVGYTSRNEMTKRMIYQTNVNFLDRFTGLTNPYAPPILNDKDSSNRGKHFYFAYAANQLAGGGNQDMTYYVSTFEQPANVTIRVNGTNWTRSFLIPPNTVYAPLPVDYLPKTGADNAFLNTAGTFDRSVEIISDVSVVAYAHAIGSASSGATMLLPVGVWGYEYKTLCLTGTGSYSDSRPYFYVIADNDNTQIEITPSVAVQNAGINANVVNTVILNKGQVLQVLSTGATSELTGSIVKSVANSAGKCFPIAVFSGNSRINITISGCSSGGDFVMQQNFPATAWGKKYLTAPSSFSSTAFNTAANPFATNIYRVAVQDPTTVVKRNGVQIPTASLVNGHYYQFQTNFAEYIEADKPIMMAQFMGGSGCVGGPGSDGDPEMFYVSPIEQGIKEVGFYRNNQQAINVNYLTMIVPTNGLASLKIYDGGVLQTPDYTYAHPQNGAASLNGVNYTVVIKRWASSQQQVRVICDSSFTGITYGLGSVESYGYNMGTLVKNLRATGGSVTSTPSGGVNVEYTCTNAPFRFSMRLAVKPTNITWKFSQVPNLTPNTDVSINNPTPTDSVLVNGDLLYVYTLPQFYTISVPGFYTVPVTFKAPTIGSCDSTQTDVIYVQVIPSPAIGFNVTFAPPCAGNTANFAAQAATTSGVNASSWTWTFHNATTASGQNATFTYPTAGTYPVKLSVVTADGCVGDSTKQVVVNPLPTITVVSDSVTVCSGANATFTIQNPVTGTIYNWYSSATATTPIFTGTSYTATGITNTTIYYIEAVSAAGCTSATRLPVKAQVYNALPVPVVTVTNSTANSVTFSWTAITGAQAYQVSVNGGAFGTPSSGATGLTHTVTGLGVLTSTNIVVKAIGVITCQNSSSVQVSGCTNSAPIITQDSVAICVNGGATFTVDAPLPTNVTYTWYNSSTSTTPLTNGGNYSINTSGSSFGVSNLTPAGIYTFYSLGANTVSGCTGTIRKKVTINVLAPLAKAVVTVNNTLATPTSITFQWSAVTGAVGGYQISMDNGTTWQTPSTGSFGLSHTVSGLQPNTSVTILVKAIGTIPCQNSISDAVTGRTLIDQIFVPGAFNPNSTITVNRTVRVYGYVIKTMNFMIFNQWGEKVFETQDQNIGWDGNYKGKPQPAGVYIYVLKMTLQNGTNSEMKGAINLIR